MTEDGRPANAETRDSSPSRNAAAMVVHDG